jgi:ribulose-phosphate 3-epimerase
MTPPIKISPSLLSADILNLLKCALEAQKGGADSLHIDLMGGHYCHNFSFGRALVPALKEKTNLPLVVHLEIENPDEFIYDFVDSGADTIIVQEDTCPNLPRTIDSIQSRGVKAGIGINPDRWFEKIDASPWLLKQIDLLLILAAYPGFGGQRLSPLAIRKTKLAVNMREDSGARFDIGVDGGVNDGTVPCLVRAGVNYLIAGSAVFGDQAIAENVSRIKVLAQHNLPTK